MRRHSLSTRLVAIYVVLGTLLTALYGIGSYVAMAYIEDTFIAKSMENEAREMIKDVLQRPDTDLHEGKYVNSYIGLEGMPPDVRSMVEGLEPGAYETGGPYAIDGPPGTYVLVQPIEGRKDWFYLVYDMSELEAQKKKATAAFFLAGFFIVAGLSAFLAHKATRRLTRPMQQLTEMVNAAGMSDAPPELPQGFATSLPDDEVGFLAKKLNEYMVRINQLIGRERAFTREASHELRTPVTVVKGAVELLERDPDLPDASRRAVERIRRSATDMEDVIDTFLWLAREESSPEEKRTAPVLEVAREVLDRFRAAKTNPDVKLGLDALGPASARVPESAFRIALSNLLDNALKHTARGTVTVRVLPERVVVADTGTGIEQKDLPRVTRPLVRGAASTGHGIGLSIVGRLCDRFGWELAIDSAPGQGTTVTLLFVPADKSRAAGKKA